MTHDACEQSDSRTEATEYRRFNHQLAHQATSARA
jgi:hypothetical protein